MNLFKTTGIVLPLRIPAALDHAGSFNDSCSTTIGLSPLTNSVYSLHHKGIRHWEESGGAWPIHPKKEVNVEPQSNE
jgi:hypothetical protein